jgi:hypothetical protein
VSIVKLREVRQRAEGDVSSEWPLVGPEFVTVDAMQLAVRVAQSFGRINQSHTLY